MSERVTDPSPFKSDEKRIADALERIADVLENIQTRKW